MLWSRRQGAVTPEQVITAYTSRQPRDGPVSSAAVLTLLTWSIVISLDSLASNRICQLYVGLFNVILYNNLHG